MIKDYPENIWRIRQYFIKNFSFDSPIVNDNQMPLHRNESSCQATVNFNETFVKENPHVARKRSTAFTEAASDPNVVLPLEFVFKGTG